MTAFLAIVLLLCPPSMASGASEAGHAGPAGRAIRLKSPAASARKQVRDQPAALPRAEGPPARVSITPSPASIGDRVKCEIALTTPPAMRLTPLVTATRLADWDVLGIKTEESRPAPAGQIEQRFSVFLIPWSQTLTATPSFAFTAMTPPGRVEMLTVPPAPVKMASVLGAFKETDDLRPLKGVIGYRSWWPLILALAAIALAAGGWQLWKNWKRRKAGIGTHPSAPPVPPEVAARKALEALLSKNLLEQGQVKLFYIELSDIFRRYIEGRFGVPALDLTTSELLPCLRRREELRPLYGDTRAFLDGSDLVKFAKYVPDRDEITADIGRVRLVIDRTSPPPTAALETPPQAADQNPPAVKASL
jgi:hypothetical protein